MKITKLYLFVLLVTTVLGSCTKEPEDVFDKSATERIDERVNEIYSIIQQQKKWIIEYYPHSEKMYGGFTIFADFSSASEVSLSSDEVWSATQSSYQIIKDAGPVLTFNTYNKVIHKYSEPGVDSGTGPQDNGMGGDFEFLVLTATPELITLKGKKSGNVINMVPFTSPTPEVIIRAYQTAVDLFNEGVKFNFVLADSSIFPLTKNSRTFKDSNNPDSKIMPFRITNTGIEFYKEEEFKGLKFKSLNYVDPTDEFPFGYYTNSTNTIKLVRVITPIAEWFRQKAWSFSRNGVGALGSVFWNDAAAAFAANNLILDNVFIGTVNNLVGMRYYLQGATIRGVITHSITPVANTTDQVTIQLVGDIYGIASTPFGIRFWTAGLNHLTTPLNGRTFVLTGVDRADEPGVILLTDIEIPSNTFTLSLEEVRDPFNN